jgi:hypothetical protein
LFKIDVIIHVASSAGCAAAKAGVDLEYAPGERRLAQAGRLEAAVELTANLGGELEALYRTRACSTWPSYVRPSPPPWRSWIGAKWSNSRDARNTSRD